MAQGVSQVILILFLISVGFLIGAVLGNWMGGREAASKAKKTAAQTKEPAPKPLLNPNEFEEMVSLWRKKVDGSLVVVRGREVLAQSSLLGEERRKQLEQTARDWLVWLGLLPGKSAKPAPVQTAETPLAPDITPTASKPAPAVVPQPIRSQPIPAPVIYTPPPEPVSVTAPSILDSVTQVLTPTLPDAKKPLSIVQQINEILQEKLRETELFKRGIRLSEDPREGVIVHIGLQRYAGIDSVPDAEVKAVIKAAVAEWERKSEAPK